MHVEPSAGFELTTLRSKSELRALESEAEPTKPPRCPVMNILLKNTWSSGGSTPVKTITVHVSKHKPRYVSESVQSAVWN